MSINTIDAKTLQKMFIAGAKSLEAKKEWINDLNVFPVPDGDTGTNMTMTITSAVNQVVAVENVTMSTLSSAIANGSLRGARGNSGVILSQLFRGFCKEITGVEEIDTIILAKACKKAVETAYKAVMKPKEGTILTVAKGMSDKALELCVEMDDVVEMIREVIKEGNDVLAKTPDMLPVLKEAGVVDSGGQGLMVFVTGALGVLTGEVADFEVEMKPAAKPVVKSAGNTVDDVDIKFGYCTEFIIMLEKEFTEADEDEFKAYLGSIGDSIVCVADDEIVKIHVHTNDPGLAIQKALTYGSLTRMKIDNMREEHNERVIKQQELEAGEVDVIQPDENHVPEKREPFGFVAVSAGDGLAEIFEGLGANQVIKGGQTMNPSTEDIIQAVEKVNADVVYVLPNNSNIILAAQQTARFVADKKVVVIPTKTIPQGIAALINFEMSKSPQENEQDMLEGIKAVKSGQLTYAVRDTSIDGVEIKCNNIMGLGDAGLLAVGTDINDTAVKMLDKMMTDESSLISIYYGTDVTEEDAQALNDKISEAYPDMDIELQYGGQPVYYYIVSVE